jgi:arylsulfatase
MFLSTLVTAIGGSAWCADGSEELDRRPNFIVFLVDDVGYADIGVQGATGFQTPNLDRMAAEGMRFSDFYVHPVCGVTRAALMTGCYAMRVAEVNNTKNGHPVLHADEITMAEVLKSAGYATGMIGKWHLAGGQGKSSPDLMPNAQGFDYWFGSPVHNGFTRTIEGSNFRMQLMRNNQLLDEAIDQQEMDEITQRYTEEAVGWIKQNKDRPFFLYLAHNMAHVVLGASEAFRGTSNRGLYGDVMQELDWSAGQVMATLQELGIDDNTLMVFTSDNGPWVEEHLAGATPQDDHYGRATPLRGYKMTTWEGGHRVPCIFRWPGKVPAAAVCREPAAIIDLLPTFAALAEGNLPDDRIIDGRDIQPLLAGRPDARSPHEALYYYSFVHLQAVRSGKWKLVLPRPAKPPWCSWSARMTEAVPERQLYNLDTDVGETRDVADQHPEEVARLMQLLEDAREDLGDYNRIGSGQRFFDEGPRRSESRRWLPAQPADGGGPYPRTFVFADAIAHEPGVTRRDPSDVICVDGTHYVWYSKVKNESRVYSYPSGYSADVYFATSPDGHTWTEQGPAIDKGPEGSWDEHGVFTPNILVLKGKYYLYYTGVAAGHGLTTPTQIGVAVSNSPNGPWTRFEGNPVLSPSDDATKFDSMRVDDASLVVRGGKVWLYYKGRQQERTPGETHMGVAIGKAATGPFVKYRDAQPLHPGHEVLVWPHGTGVASLATSAGPRQVYFAADGLEFEARTAVANVPRAPGAFRSDAFQNDIIGQGLKWGVGHAGRGDLHLVRFDCQFTGPAPANPAGRRAGVRPVPYDEAEPVGDLRFDFESGDAQGWTVVEGELGVIVSARDALPQWTDVPFNKQGRYYLSTIDTEDGVSDSMTGVIQSPIFTLTGTKMSFLVGGGDHEQTHVALCTVDGEELMRAGGTNSPVLRRVNWDVSEHQGKRVVVRIIDRKQRTWAHLTFDDFSTEGRAE